jgi:hypothetical protein
MKTEPKLYRGAFDFKKKAMIIYRWANTEKAAWSKMCKEISDKDLVPLSFVRETFPFEKRDNWSITEELMKRKNE